VGLTWEIFGQEEEEEEKAFVGEEML
jgi:hypothetical protein